VEAIGYFNGKSDWAFYSTNGSVGFRFQREAWIRDNTGWFYDRYERSPDNGIWGEFASPKGRATGLQFPNWLLSSIAFIIVFGRFLLIRIQIRNRKLDPGKVSCHQCSYDIRYSPLRCPECGSPASNASLLAAGRR